MSNVMHPDYLNDFKTLLAATNGNDLKSIDMIVSRLKKHEPGAIMLLMEYPVATNSAVVAAVTESIKKKDNFGRLTFDQLLHFKGIEETVYAQVLVENLSSHPECAVMAHCLPISSIPGMMEEINKIFDKDEEIKNLASAAKDFEEIPEYVEPVEPPPAPGPSPILHE